MKKLPVMFIRDAVIYPVDTGATLHIGREESIHAIRNAIQSFNKRICIVAQIDPAKLLPSFADIHQYGTVCEIEKSLDFDDGTLKIFIKGEAAFKVVKLEKSERSNFCEYEEMTHFDSNVINQFVEASKLSSTEDPCEIQRRIDLFKEISITSS